MNFDESKLEQYMRQCIDLAMRARSQPVGRPHVGALVVAHDGCVVGEGHRTLVDGTSLLLHAEREALDNAGENARGNYLFTTLEPCAYSRWKNIFKPCAELIVERGITTVVYGLLDNSPTVHSGEGISYLKRHKVKVIRYDRLNDVILKNLMSLPYRLEHRAPRNR